MTKEKALKAYDDLVQLRRKEVLIKSKDNPGKIEIHHIVPISIGGIDDESNKIALLAKEHFMAHVYLFIIHHNDRFHDQMTYALMNMHKGIKNGFRKEIREFILMSEEYQLAREEFGKIVSKTFHEANVGQKNPMYGKRWIYNTQTKECKIISSNEPLLDGWKYGKYQTATKKAKEQIKIFSHCTKGKHQIFNPTTNEVRYLNDNDPLPEGFERRGRPLKEQDKQKLKSFYKKNNEENIAPKRLKELRPMYQYYCQHGWNDFKKYFNYQHTQQNFVGLCKRYLPEFISHQGKKIS